MMTNQEFPRRNILPNIRHPDFLKALNLGGSKSNKKERFKNEASNFKLTRMNNDHMNLNLTKNLLIHSNFHRSNKIDLNSLNSKKNFFDDLISRKNEYDNNLSKISFKSDSLKNNNNSIYEMSSISPVKEKEKEKIHLKDYYLRKLSPIRKKFEDNPSISVF